MNHLAFFMHRRLLVKTSSSLLLSKDNQMMKQCLTEIELKAAVKFFYHQASNGLTNVIFSGRKSEQNPDNNRLYPLENPETFLKYFIYH